MAAPRVAMVAGEASGDLLAGLVLDGLRARWPDLQATGIGGPQMVQRGFQADWPSDKLAVHGYSIEVFRRLGELLRIRKQLRERLLRERPDVFVGVDAPDFNLGLEAALKAQGIPTVHFVCPSSGPGVPTGSRKSAARPTMCCVSSRSSPPCWQNTVLPPPMSATLWPA